MFPQPRPHVLLDLLPDHPALGVPEHHAGRLLLQVKQIQLLAELAVVAFFCLLQAVEIGIEVFLPGPRGAVDALQHLVTRIAPPVGTGQPHQLEHLELAGGRHVGTAAQVGEIPLPIQGNLLPFGNRLDDLGLVVLAQLAEITNRVGAGHDQTGDRQILLDEFGHAFLDRRQVFRGERALVGKIVVEAVLHHRPDGHLGIGEQLFDRLGQQVRGGMPDDLQAFRILVRHDGEIRVLLDAIGGIHQLAIDLAGERRARQPGTDGFGHLRHGHGVVELASGAIGQADGRHGGDSRIPVTQTTRARTEPDSRLAIGRRDWTRTNDPHHVKVML